MNAITQAELHSLSNNHLDALEEETIFILREVAAAFERPTLLFSGGKDSLVMLKCAEKAFGAGRMPYPLLMIDTGHNFKEVTDFRDFRAKELGAELIVRSVEDSMRRGTVRLAHPGESRNVHQSVTLLEAIEEFRFDALIGGARRDEEKARAKERVFSHRDAFGQWDPRRQRPELWDLYNGRHRADLHLAKDRRERGVGRIPTAGDHHDVLGRDAGSGVLHDDLAPAIGQHVRPARAEGGVDAAHHRIQSGRQFRRPGEFKGQAGLADAGLGAHQPLPHRGGRGQEAARDARRIQPQHGLQHQRCPHTALDGGVGAGEQ